MAGVAPALFSWLALAGERVVPVTSWPAATRLGMRYWPMTPVAPATKTRMIRVPFLCPVAYVLYDAAPPAGVTPPFSVIQLTPAQVPGAGDRADVTQLVGVGDHPDGLDLAVEHVERDDHDQAAVGVPGQHARLPVHPGRRQHGAQLQGPLDLDADQLGHLLAPVQRSDERDLALAAAVPVEQHVRGQPLEQAAHVAAARHGQEQGGELLALGPGRLEPRPSLVDAAAGPGEHLPAGGLGLAGDAGDLAVAVAEYLAEQEHGALGRRQALQQHQERQRQRVGGLGELGRVGPALQGPAPVLVPTSGSGSQVPT